MTLIIYRIELEDASRKHISHLVARQVARKKTNHLESLLGCCAYFLIMVPLLVARKFIFFHIQRSKVGGRLISVTYFSAWTEGKLST